MLSDIISSPELKAQGELTVWDSSELPFIHASTLSNMNISETSWPIVIKELCALRGYSDPPMRSKNENCFSPNSSY